MKVRWRRVGMLLLAIVALLISLTHCAEIHAFVGSIEHLGSREATVHEHTQGMIAFGLTAVCLLGLIRLLKQGND